MTYTKYKEWYVEIGWKMARALATGYGISWAQIQLWNIKLERETLAALEKQAMYDPVR